MGILKILATALLSLVVINARALTLDSTKVYRKALQQIAKCENRPMRNYIVADSVFFVIMEDYYGALVDYPQQQKVLEYINTNDTNYITPHLSSSLLPLAKHKAEKLKKARIAMCYEPKKWRLVFFSEIKDGMVWANVFYVEYAQFLRSTSLKEYFLDFPHM